MLLIAVDTEGCAATVAQEAVHLARDLGEEVRLLTCVQPPAGAAAAPMHGAYEGATVESLLVDEARRALDGLVTTFTDVGCAAQADVRVGPPQDVVVEVVNELKPRMLVLGTHGRTGLKRLLLGSVAESIARHSPVPVFMVPGGSAEPVHGPGHAQVDAESDG